MLIYTCILLNDFSYCSKPAFSNNLPDEVIVAYFSHSKINELGNVDPLAIRRVIRL